MRRTALALAAAAAFAGPAHAAPVLEVGPGGAVMRDDPYLPPSVESDLPRPGGRAQATRARPAAKTTVRKAITRAYEAGLITTEERDRYRAAYSSALRTRSQLGGL